MFKSNKILGCFKYEVTRAYMFFISWPFTSTKFLIKLMHFFQNVIFCKFDLALKWQQNADESGRGGACSIPRPLAELGNSNVYGLRPLFIAQRVYNTQILVISTTEIHHMVTESYFQLYLMSTYQYWFMFKA